MYCIIIITFSVDRETTIGSGILQLWSSDVLIDYKN